MVKLNRESRIVTDKRTGKRHLVEKFDVDLRKFLAWKEVTAVTAQEAEVGGGLLTILECYADVAHVVLSRSVAESLFTECVASGQYAGQVALGSYKIKRTPSRTSVVKNPVFGTPCVDKRCPVHGAPMYKRRNKNGGVFYSCERFLIDGCDETFGADGKYYPGRETRAAAE